MDGWITIGTELDTKQFDKQIQALERKANELEDVLKKKKEIGLSSREVEEVEVELEKVRNKLIQLNKEKDKLNTPISKGISGIDDLGKSFEKTIQKASRLVLSIFGIRSAYMALRRASSQLATYDEQYATNLEYIRYVLTQAIAPVLRHIVDLAMTLLSYINAIAQAWFGVNLFANGSAENFKKMKSQAGGVSKAVKEIKKQLMGFDEVNVLTADSDTGTGVGGAGVGALPSMDLSKLDRPVPKWINWIAKHGDEILAFFAGLITGLKLLKHGVEGVKALGIGLMVAGIVEAIMGLIKYLKDPSWENFGKIIQGIGGFILGLGLTIQSLPVAITGAIILIIGTIIKYWDEIKDFLQKGIDWLVGKTEWVRKIFGNTGVAIFEYITGLLQDILNWFDMVFTNIKQIFDGLISFIKGVFTGNWQMAFDGLKNIVSGVFNIILNTVVGTFTNIIDKIKLKINIITGFFKDIINITTGWFEKMGIAIPETIAQKFKDIINWVLGAVENLLNRPIEALNALIAQINSLPGVNISSLGTIHFDRLASGGIVNMPNKGRLIGGQAIAGESGAERSYSFDRPVKPWKL